MTKKEKEATLFNLKSFLSQVDTFQIDGSIPVHELIWRIEKDRNKWVEALKLVIEGKDESY